MPRYSLQEQAKLAELKTKVAKQLEACNHRFPEIVGDRKLLRFLRGHDYDVEKVAGMVDKFLQWRKDNRVDDIRHNILIGGCDQPSKFPKAEVILRLLPQAVLCPNARDKQGAPISIEKFNFSPGAVMESVTIQEYILFLLYCLEYKSLVAEQLSEEADQSYLKSLSPEEQAVALSNEPISRGDSATSPQPQPSTPTTRTTSSALPAPFGKLVGLCIIRDLDGLGWEHIGSKGQEILKTIIGVSSDNYPELLRKCFMVNAPWLFTTLWYFVQGLLSARSLAKIVLTGTNFKAELEKDISPEFIPSFVGGPFNAAETNNQAFPFDLNYFYPNMSAEEMDAIRQDIATRTPTKENSGKVKDDSGKEIATTPSTSEVSLSDLTLQEDVKN